MANTTYSYEGSNDFFIREGILKGISTPFVPKYNNYGEMILECLRSNPEFIGQIDGITGRKESLREMMEKSVKCAIWLKKQNIETGDVIGICTHNQMDLYVPFLASLYIGAVFNPWWDDGLTKDIARHFFNLTKPKMLFIHDESLDVALEVMRELGMNIKFVIFGKRNGFLSLGDVLKSEENSSVDGFRCAKSTTLDDPAFIVYTSGTTGLPKGIVTTHKSIFGNSRNFHELGRFNENVISINFSSISWGVGIACLLRAVTVPETRIIHRVFHAETVLRLIEKFKINLMHLSPRKACEFHKSPTSSKHDLSSLKILWISGGVLRGETQNAIAENFPQARVHQAYGSSELGGVAFRQKSNFKPSSCGTIVKNMTMKIIDPATRKILGPNENGEACFASSFMMTEYLNNPDATKKTIDSEGWLHSGDLVHYDEEGHVFVTDRISEMIIHRDRLISPETIEQTMYMGHPDIVEIAVVSISDNENRQHPVAFVTKSPGSQATEKEFEKLMADALSDDEELHRGSVKFLTSIPRLLSGKIARAELKKLSKSCAR